MYANKETILAMAEKALNVKAGANNDWCVRWLERHWHDEINMAIYDVKRR